MRLNSLRTKIIAVAMGLVVLLGVAVTTVILPRVRDASRDEFRKTALIIAKAVASDATAALTTEDHLALRSRMMTYRQADEDVAYIFICDPQGNVLLHTFGQTFPRGLLSDNVPDPGGAYRVETLTTGDDTIDDIAMPIFQGQLGTVHVGMSWKTALADERNATALTIAAALGVIIVGAILMLMVTGRIMRPLGVLRQDVEALSSDNLDHRVQVASRDEVGALAGAFNRMIERLKASNDEQTRANQNLQKEILQRKTTAASLRKSESEKEAILNGLKDVMVEYVDQDMKLIWANEAMATTFGIRRDTLPGKRCFEFVHGRSEPCPDCTAVKAIATGEPHEGEVVTPDGRVFMVRSNPVTDAEGKIVGVVHAALNITERKQAEKALGESQEKYKGIVENLGIGVSLISPEMEILELNSQMRKWYPNITPGKGVICYRQFNDPPRDMPCSYCPTILTLRDGQVHEATTETPAGDKIICFRVVSSPIKDAAGRVVAAVEMVEDITARRQMEKELQESRKALEQRVAERTTELVQANQRLAQAQMDLVQKEKMSMLGQLSAGVAHEMNTPIGAILNVMADGMLHLREFIATGQPICELPDDARQWCMGTCIRMLTESAHQSDSERRTVSDRIEKDIAGLGFEKPRHVAAIIAACFGTNWREEPKLLDYLSIEPVLKALEHMHSLKTTMEISTISARKVARIIRALKQYSRSGQDDVSEVDIGESLDNTLAILHNRIKQIAEIRVSVEPDLPAVRCTPDISQVWTNILNNACDAIEGMPGGQGGQIEVAARSDGGYVVVDISNNGPPIPEQNMSRIYDPFFTTKPVGKGTGLGLGICAGLVQRSGGTIAARNDQGKVTFVVRLRACGVQQDAKRTGASGASLALACAARETGTETSHE